MPDQIDIVVDDREARSGVLDILGAMHGVSVTVRRLDVGDYEVDHRLLVERKTLSDLAVSIRDGRLFKQACRLAQTKQLSSIMLEGTAKDLALCNMRREALQGALITLTLFLGIPLLRSRNLHETVQLMIYAARQGRAIATGALPRHGVRPRGKRKVQFHILQGFPGVGPERARALLDTFGSIEAVLTASMDALTSIDGIGTHTAESIHWAVHEIAADYGTFDSTDDPIL